MHVEWISEIGSTNTELVRRASVGDVPQLSALATTNQTAGRGRLGRTWVSPQGTTLAVSIFVRASDGLGWLPLLAGLAMTRAVRSLLPGQLVTLKWPNDVLVDGLKVSGLLGELVPSGGAVMGAGLNLTMTKEQLPVPTATSLTLHGAEPDALLDRALAEYLAAFEALWGEFEDSGFDADAGAGAYAGADADAFAAPGLRASVSDACDTLGRDVRVGLPDGSTAEGMAEAIDEHGRLVVRHATGHLVVSAGDVTHVRYG